MKYEELGDSIIFDVDTDRHGKWGIVNALEQVTLFWKTVAHYEVFRRKDFDSIIIKITRDNFMETIKENNDSLGETKNE